MAGGASAQFALVPKNLLGGAEERDGARGDGVPGDGAFASAGRVRCLSGHLQAAGFGFAIV